VDGNASRKGLEWDNSWVSQFCTNMKSDFKGHPPSSLPTDWLQRQPLPTGGFAQPVPHSKEPVSQYLFYQILPYSRRAGEEEWVGPAEAGRQVLDGHREAGRGPLAPDCSASWEPLSPGPSWGHPKGKTGDRGGGLPF
jgi:hypothetical protein